MGEKIVPKHLAKGVDFCAIGKYYYIVRSDLGCYMSSTDFSSGEDLEILSLHPSCREGDHYLADSNGKFYIIKGNCYRRVNNMTTGEDPNIYILHPNCRGGDHYLSAHGHFYIIHQSRGIYRKTKSLDLDKEGVEYTLHSNCKDGLYYFGIDDHYCFVKTLDQSGVQYLKSTCLHEDLNSQTLSFHPSVINFLPGGLGVTMGSVYGEHVCIKTITNDSVSPVEWKKTFSRKTGYEKEKLSSIKHNWKVSAAVTAESRDLSALVTQRQFSLTEKYGGSGFRIEQETWSEVAETEEAITVNLQPHQGLYMWRYQLGLGKEPVLYCHDVRILDDPNPPVDVPLPPAVN